MKTLKIILVALLIMPLTTMAQKGAFDDFFDKYSNSDDVTSVSISLGGLKIVFNGDDKVGDLFKLMDQVDKINILSFENHYKSFRNSDFFKEVNAIIEKHDYEQLIDVKSKDENISVYIIEGENGMVKEGLIIANEDDEATIISVRGNMNVSDFLSMHKHMPNFHKKHKKSKHY